uniref:RAP domain-containing protein n=1 Tax=Chromera velia CCMP2878 TaxID=1169474 RepID=A0A0G4HTU2_9ALVE|eukprot:Cvel_8541.t1-p1 / transcript=Cvel_8541.t1 / gene=Cvel_8541 / organism=Chromera_velia_CCMP2878 / gene_product=hypothetical protein / transcript_product=hypothetical protein / location=Cvel_scaffold473:66564-73537(+) / protein_length=879 / sequence_SO=supercontig / SO=protein_coding / is_pseudo=false
MISKVFKKFPRGSTSRLGTVGPHRPFSGQSAAAAFATPPPAPPKKPAPPSQGALNPPLTLRLRPAVTPPISPSTRGSETEAVAAGSSHDAETARIPSLQAENEETAPPPSSLRAEAEDTFDQPLQQQQRNEAPFAEEGLETAVAGEASHASSSPSPSQHLETLRRIIEEGGASANPQMPGAVEAAVGDAVNFNLEELVETMSLLCTLQQRAALRDVAPFVLQRVSDQESASPESLQAATQSLNFLGRAMIYYEALFQYCDDNLSQMDSKSLALYAYEGGRHGLRCKHLLDRAVEPLTALAGQGQMSVEDMLKAAQGLIRFTKDWAPFFEAATERLLEAHRSRGVLKEVSNAELLLSLRFCRDLLHRQQSFQLLREDLCKELKRREAERELSLPEVSVAFSCLDDRRSVSVKREQRTSYVRQQQQQHAASASASAAAAGEETHETAEERESGTGGMSAAADGEGVLLVDGEGPEAREFVVQAKRSLETMPLQDFLRSDMTVNDAVNVLDCLASRGMSRSTLFARLGDFLVENIAEVRHSTNIGLWLQGLEAFSNADRFHPGYIGKCADFGRDEFMVDRISIFQQSRVLNSFARLDYYDERLYNVLGDRIAAEFSLLKFMKEIAPLLTAYARANHIHTGIFDAAFVAVSEMIITDALPATKNMTLGVIDAALAFCVAGYHTREGFPVLLDAAFRDWDPSNPVALRRLFKIADACYHEAPDNFNESNAQQSMLEVLGHEWSRELRTKPDCRGPMKRQHEAEYERAVQSVMGILKRLGIKGQPSIAPDAISSSLIDVAVDAGEKKGIALLPPAMTLRTGPHGEELFTGTGFFALQQRLLGARGWTVSPLSVSELMQARSFEEKRELLIGRLHDLDVDIPFLDA